MAPDLHAVSERLAAQPAAEKVIRNQLISQGYSIREATARAARITKGGRAGQITEGPPAGRSEAITEAVAAAVLTAAATRKAAKKAARRATAEAAAARVLQERRQLAAQFTEDAAGKSLRESTADDLAAIAATGMSGRGQSSPAGRPVAELTVNPQALDLQEIGIAAAAGMTGSSPFWEAQPGASRAAGQSPFWRGLQASGASKGTADA